MVQTDNIMVGDILSLYRKFSYVVLADCQRNEDHAMSGATVPSAEIFAKTSNFETNIYDRTKCCVRALSYIF
jgi:hypothetical protein